MKLLPKIIYLSKDLFHQSPGECITLRPEFPSGGVENQQLYPHSVQSLQRQVAKPLSLFSHWQMLFASASL